MPQAREYLNFPTLLKLLTCAHKLLVTCCFCSLQPDDEFDVENDSDDSDSEGSSDTSSDNGDDDDELLPVEKKAKKLAKKKAKDE